MSRFAVKITPEELKDKAVKIGFISYTEDEYGEIATYDTDLLPPQVGKDLSKIDFNFENFYFSEDDEDNRVRGMFGIRTIGSLTFLGCMAGGDWEWPVYFIVYWDGQSLRAYIPNDGNVWNRNTKRAIGNDIEEDRAYLAKALGLSKEELRDPVDRAEELFDAEKIKADIINRIVVRG